MRIAIVSEYFYPTLGGIQEHLYFFSKELLKRGHKPTIVTSRVSDPRPLEEWWPKDLPRECHHTVGTSLPVFSNGSVARTTIGIGVAGRLKRLLTPQNFDLVHLHAPIFGLLPVLATRYSSVPTFGTLHTSFPPSNTLRIFRPLIQRQLDRLDGVIGVSPSAITSLQSYADFEAELIPNGIDTDFFHPLAEGPDDRMDFLNDGKINIFFIGRPDPRNGLGPLIEAFGAVHKLEPQTRLVVAGDGPDMPKYRELASRLLPPQACLFLGAVHAQRPQLYRSCHIHAFCVEKAACALTLLEGMASGLAILTSPFHGYEFIEGPEETFLLSPFGNIEELKKQLLALVRSPELRATLGAAARRRAQSFGWSKITDRILQVYARNLSQVSASPNARETLTQSTMS